MRRIVGAAALYIALGLGANAQEGPDAAPGAAPGAPGAAPASLAGLAVGEMAGLTVHDAPRPLPEADLLTPEGAPAALPAGRPAVVNFWATWCAPCRVEMPHLAALHEAMGDEAHVVLVATGRNDPEAALAFLADVGATELTDLRDPAGSLGRGVGIRGLPTTLVLDAEGREVARLTGIADWGSEDAQALLRALAGG